MDSPKSSSSSTASTLSAPQTPALSGASGHTDRPVVPALPLDTLPPADPVPEMPKEVPQDLKVLRVAIRMLMDYAKVMTDGTRGYEIGCRCKDEFIAQALVKVIESAVGSLPCVVTTGGDNVVIIRDVV